MIAGISVSSNVTLSRSLMIRSDSACFGCGLIWGFGGVGASVWIELSVLKRQLLGWREESNRKKMLKLALLANFP